MVWPRAAGVEMPAARARAVGGPAFYEEQTIDFKTPSTNETVVQPEQIGGYGVDCNCLQFGWPIPAVGINSLFGDRTDPIDGGVRYHAGVDLDAEYGTVVVASANGVISEADWRAGHGRRVVIDHTGGYRSVYSHLSQVLIEPGTRVRSGQAIGRVGNSGRSTGPHLHFEINRWGRALDPLEVLEQVMSLD